MPPKPKSDNPLDQLASQMKKARIQKAKQARQELEKAQKELAKPRYQPVIPRRQQTVIEKGKTREEQKQADLDVFERVIANKSADNVVSILTEYTEENPSRKGIIDSIVNSITPSLILELAKEFTKSNELLEVFWESYRKRPNVKENIEKKIEVDDIAYDMRVAMEGEPGDEEKGAGTDRIKRYIDRTVPPPGVDRRHTRICPENMRLAPWLNFSVKNTWLSSNNGTDLPSELLNGTFTKETRTVMYNNIDWYEAGNGYYKLLCNSNVNISWKNGMMSITMESGETLVVRVLFQANNDTYEMQTEKMFDLFLEFRNRELINKQCARNKKRVDWVNFPVKYIVISPVNKLSDISDYVLPDAVPVPMHGFMWYRVSNNFFRLLCNRYSSMNTQESDVFKAWVSTSDFVTMRVGYVTLNDRIVMQDEAIYAQYRKTESKIIVDEKCVNLWRKVPWIPKHRVSTVYIRDGSLSEQDRENLAINKLPSNFYRASKEFFTLVCDPAVQKDQRNTNFYLQKKEYTVIYKIKGEPITLDNTVIQADDLLVVQDEKIFKDFMRVLNEQNQAEQEQIDKILDSPVNDKVKGTVADRISILLRTIAPKELKYQYIPSNPKASEFILDLVNKFKHDNIQDFLTDYAKLVVFLKPPLTTNVGNGIFQERLKQSEYTPSTLVNLSSQDKLPEVFGNNKYPVDKREFILELINTEINREVLSVATELYKNIDPSVRQATRPQVLPYMLPLAQNCLNSEQVKNMDSKDVVYYTDSDRLYCLGIQELSKAILESEDKNKPPVITVEENSGNKVTLTLDPDFIKNFNTTFTTNIIQDRLDKQERQRESGIFPELEASDLIQGTLLEQDELAPGLLEIVLENIREMKDEMVNGTNTDDEETESEESGDENEGENKGKHTGKGIVFDEDAKLGKYPCWYCKKIIDQDGEFKTIIYSDEKALMARFCTLECLENHEKWPKPRKQKNIKETKPLSTEEQRKLDELDERIDAFIEAGKKPAKKSDKTDKEEIKEKDKQEIKSVNKTVVKTSGKGAAIISKKQSKTDYGKIATEIYEELKKDNMLDMSKSKNKEELDRLIDGEITFDQKTKEYKAEFSAIKQEFDKLVNGPSKKQDKETKNTQDDQKKQEKQNDQDDIVERTKKMIEEVDKNLARLKTKF